MGVLYIIHSTVGRPIVVKQAAIEFHSLSSHFLRVLMENIFQPWNEPVRVVQSISEMLDD